MIYRPVPGLEKKKGPQMNRPKTQDADQTGSNLKMRIDKHQEGDVQAS